MFSSSLGRGGAAFGALLADTMLAFAFAVSPRASVTVTVSLFLP